MQHVLDSSAPNRDEQRESVLEVLQQIGVSNEKLENMIEVGNKVLKLKISLYPSTPIILHIHITLFCNFFCQIDLYNDTTIVMEEEDLDSWLSKGDEVKWDDASASFVGWKAFEEQPKDVSTLSGEVKSDDFNPHVKTSGITRVGLQELLELIDNKLKTDNVVERGVFDRKWRPPKKQDAGIVVG